jgi:LmbE family N-acetylglucosaminyl deacetylase
MMKVSIFLIYTHPYIGMFFVPAIKGLRQQNNISLLCLSNGNSSGLGKIREKELAASCKYLGITEVECRDNPELQDGMGSNWDPSNVAKEIR